MTCHQHGEEDCTSVDIISQEKFSDAGSNNSPEVHIKQIHKDHVFPTQYLGGYRSLGMCAWLSVHSWLTVNY